MVPRFSNLRQEFKPMATLALPVVMAELGWMTMGLVDTLMVGPLGAEAIGAVGVGSSVFMGVVIFAFGLFFGLDTLVSHAFGARRLEECHRWLVHGTFLAVLLSIPFSGALWGISSRLDGWGLHPDVLVLTRPYLEVVTWSALPLLLYCAFRRYLQGMGVVRPIMVALVMANLANVLFNWILIFGKFGAPALGVAGAAWATVGSRVAMAAYLLAVIVHRERRNRPGLFQTPLTIEFAWLRRLLALGAPAAAQLTLEVGVFAAATALAGRLAPASLAGHQIAINVAAFTFMVPLGISSAGAVRVGHAVGRRDPAGAARAGWTALALGVGFMSCAAATFLLIPKLMIGAFTKDDAVIAIGASLLMIGAVFQMFDGLQGVATGVLRGLGDTRTPMLWNLAGHWFIGLPLGYTLCFITGLGVTGLWWGLSAGLIICGIALLVVWSRRIHELEGLGPAAGKEIPCVDSSAL
jgi:MATE family multidrug resistance protein